MKEKIIVERYYIEIGRIRLIFENGEYIGWYEPDLDRVLQ